MGELAAPLLDALLRAPDPDAALVGFSRYVATRHPRTTFLHYLVDDPHALSVLIDVMGTSPFLTEILIRDPEYLHWLAAQVMRSAPDAHQLVQEVERSLDRVGGAPPRASMRSSASSVGRFCVLPQGTSSVVKRSSRQPVRF